eukprot:TRINITY_DN6988_c0_g1_i1.p1 TRINITY_DN6988_c0_g1~~TRINITY_DN6988_c0_g1_i1.p1  ORF type:complete len:486 (+),score=96.69 TRINITY_DN6988_c0_g1_i1:51-1460(+)
MGFGSACLRMFGDLDETFSYVTFRKVKLRDRWLGLVNFFLQLAIFLYVIVWEIVLKKGYLLMEPPAGNTRISLECKADCYSAIQQEVFGGTSYCTNASRGLGVVPHVRQDCMFMAPLAASYPPGLGNRLLITTRISYTNYTWNCDASDWECWRANWNKACNTGPPCEPEGLAKRQDFFAAGVEHFTLLLDHNVRGSQQVTKAKNLRNMQGALVDCNGNTIKKFPKIDDSCVTSECRNNDITQNRIITIGQLMQASSYRECDDDDVEDCRQFYCGSADLLNKPSKVDSLSSPSTWRWDGMVVLVEINYDNTRNVNEFEYTITSSLLPRTDYKLEHFEELQPPVRGTRVLENRHGIFIVVVQTGRICQFMFQKLLTVLTTSLALLKISSTIVDMLATMAMPLREHYTKYMMLTSDQFTLFRKNRRARRTSLEEEMVDPNNEPSLLPEIKPSTPLPKEESSPRSPASDYHSP